MNSQEDLNDYKAAYQNKFEYYDENQSFLAHYSQRLCHVIDERNLRSVLSLGIGYAVVIDNILEQCGGRLDRYTILEGAGEIVERFLADRQVGANVSVLHTRFEDFTSTEQFDAIEIGFVLEHVENPSQLIEQYKAFLKPGGTMFVAVPNARSLHRLIAHEAGLLADVYELSPRDDQLGHKRYFDLGSVCRLLEQAGLTISHKQGLMLKPITQGQMKQLEWGPEIVRALFAIGDNYPEIANSILVEATA